MRSVFDCACRTLLTIVLVIWSSAAATAQALPSPWSSTDVGAPAIEGTAEIIFRIQGAGTDVWGTADQFRFVYQPFTGDGEIVARVTSISAAEAKAGVMFRESLTADSPNAFMVISADNAYQFQRRPGPGASSIQTAGGIVDSQGWVRLVRRGDVFEGYRSPDGQTWSRVGSDTIPMGATVYVGLAVSSGHSTVASTATVDSVAITTSHASTNQPPAVTVAQPISGTQVSAPAVVTIAATASDPENRLSSVEFYVEGTLIDTVTSAPYSTSWTASAAGTYSLTAVAHDADGGSTTANAVSVTVSPGTQLPAAPTAVIFTASTDHATDVTSYLLSVYVWNANPMTATPIAEFNLGKPVPAADGDITVDCASFFAALPLGNYRVTVTAIGPGGETRSAGVAFRR